MTCSVDKHNFIFVKEETDTLYKCDKCGLEVLERFPHKVNLKYYGSYVNGVSYKWDANTMNVADITSFELSYGNLPIINITYEGNEMVLENKINGSRDGWMRFPEGFFAKKIIELSKKEKLDLYKKLEAIDFCSLVTPLSVFKNLFAPGFCPSDTFRCCFSNGKVFTCISPSSSAFAAIVNIIAPFVGAAPLPKPSPANYQPPLQTATSFEPIMREVAGIVVPCCNKPIPADCSFCPYCGKKVEDKSATCTFKDDVEATVWLCADCDSNNKCEYRFCTKCGTKCSW